MNKLQQAAEQLYPYPDVSKNSTRPQMNKCDTVDRERSAFLAGAAYADGAFAEWASCHGWSYEPTPEVWENADGIRCTTAEIYALWQQSI